MLTLHLVVISYVYMNALQQQPGRVSPNLGISAHPPHQAGFYGYRGPTIDIPPDPAKVRLRNSTCCCSFTELTGLHIECTGRSMPNFIDVYAG